MSFELSSPDFGHQESMPARFSADGEDLSPRLDWTDPPAGTRSLALIMDDPDAPAGLWIHWVLYDLPAGLRGLPQGLPRNASLENGARQGACWGVKSFERTGYYGPEPPPGKPHRYFFRLYALDKALSLPPGQSAAQVRAAMRAHVLAEAVLMGLYQR